MTAVVSTTVERPTSRELADLLRDLRAVSSLDTDDPRRQAWLKRKRDLLGRIETKRLQPSDVDAGDGWADRR